MDLRKKERSKSTHIRRIIEITVILALVLFIYFLQRNKIMVGKLSMELYERQNFAFTSHCVSTNGEHSPIDAVWFIDDLADYETFSNTQLDSSLEQDVMAYYQNTDGSYNWENITKLLHDEKIDVTSTDYLVFSNLMFEMTDEELEQVFNLGQICIKDTSSFLSFLKLKTYGLSEAFKHIASAYVITAYNYMQETEICYSNKSSEYVLASNQETRAFAFLQAAIEVENIPGIRGIIDISADKGSRFDDRYVYYVKVKAVPNIIDDDQIDSFFGKVLSPNLYSPTITVQPRSEELSLESRIDKVVQFDLNAVQQLNKRYMYPKKELKEVVPLLLDIGNDAVCTWMSGVLVQVTRCDFAVAYIGGAVFNPDECYLDVRAYNISKSQDLDTDSLIDHFLQYDNEYMDYYNWWTYTGMGEEKIELYKSYVNYVLYLKKQDIYTTQDQLVNAADEVDELLREKGLTDLALSDSDKIYDYIKEEYSEQ